MEYLDEKIWRVLKRWFHQPGVVMVLSAALILFSLLNVMDRGLGLFTHSISGIWHTLYAVLNIFLFLGLLYTSTVVFLTKQWRDVQGMLLWLALALLGFVSYLYSGDYHKFILNS